jgi:HipA-like protein
MQSGNVYRNGIYVGEISKDDNATYRFAYSGEYLASEDAVPISVNLPLQREPFLSKTLFAFFFNMLAEGNIKALQCKELRIDEDDHFTRLLKTTSCNTIGSITVKESTPHQNRGLGRGPGKLIGEIEAYGEGEKS